MSIHSVLSILLVTFLVWFTNAHNEDWFDVVHFNTIDTPHIKWATQPFTVNGNNPNIGQLTIEVEGPISLASIDGPLRCSASPPPPNMPDLPLNIEVYTSFRIENRLNNGYYNDDISRHEIQYMSDFVRSYPGQALPFDTQFITTPRLDLNPYKIYDDHHHNTLLYDPIQISTLTLSFNIPNLPPSVKSLNLRSIYCRNIVFSVSNILHSSDFIPNTSPSDPNDSTTASSSSESQNKTATSKKSSDKNTGSSNKNKSSSKQQQHSNKQQQSQSSPSPSSSIIRQILRTVQHPGSHSISTDITHRHVLYRTYTEIKHENIIYDHTSRSLTNHFRVLYKIYPPPDRNYSRLNGIGYKGRTENVLLEVKLPYLSHSAAMPLPDTFSTQLLYPTVSQQQQSSSSSNTNGTGSSTTLPASSSSSQQWSSSQTAHKEMRCTIHKKSYCDDSMGLSYSDSTDPLSIYSPFDISPTHCPLHRTKSTFYTATPSGSFTQRRDTSSPLCNSDIPAHYHTLRMCHKDQSIASHGATRYFITTQIPHFTNEVICDIKYTLYYDQIIHSIPGVEQLSNIMRNNKMYDITSYNGIPSSYSYLKRDLRLYMRYNNAIFDPPQVYRYSITSLHDRLHYNLSSHLYGTYTLILFDYDEYVYLYNTIPLLYFDTMYNNNIHNDEHVDILGTTSSSHANNNRRYNYRYKTRNKHINNDIYDDMYDYNGVILGDDGDDDNDDDDVIYSHRLLTSPSDDTTDEYIDHNSMSLSSSSSNHGTSGGGIVGSGYRNYKDDTNTNININTPPLLSIMQYNNVQLYELGYINNIDNISNLYFDISAFLPSTLDEQHLATTASTTGTSRNGGPPRLALPSPPMLSSFQRHPLLPSRQTSPQSSDDDNDDDGGGSTSISHPTSTAPSSSYQNDQSSSNNNIYTVKYIMLPPTSLHTRVHSYPRSPVLSSSSYSLSSISQHHHQHHQQQQQHNTSGNNHSNTSIFTNVFDKSPDTLTPASQAYIDRSYDSHHHYNYRPSHSSSLPDANPILQRDRTARSPLLYRPRLPSAHQRTNVEPYRKFMDIHSLSTVSEPSISLHAMSLSHLFELTRVPYYIIKQLTLRSSYDLFNIYTSLMSLHGYNNNNNTTKQKGNKGSGGVGTTNGNQSNPSASSSLDPLIYQQYLNALYDPTPKYTMNHFINTHSISVLDSYSPRIPTYNIFYNIIANATKTMTKSLISSPNMLPGSTEQHYVFSRTSFMEIIIPIRNTHINLVCDKLYNNDLQPNTNIRSRLLIYIQCLFSNWNT